MRTGYESYRMINFQSIPDLANDLISKNYMLRKKAREELVDLAKLTKHEDETVRWEAVLTIVQIGTRETLDILLNCLEDDEFSIRWLAAQGVVNQGKYAIMPLLRELKNKPDSIFLRHGAHHVLRELRKKGFFKDNYYLIEALSSEFEHPIIQWKLQKTINSIRLN